MTFVKDFRDKLIKPPITHPLGRKNWDHLKESHLKVLRVQKSKLN